MTWLGCCVLFMNTRVIIKKEYQGLGLIRTLLPLKKTNKQTNKSIRQIIILSGKRIVKTDIQIKCGSGAFLLWVLCWLMWLTCYAYVYAYLFFCFPALQVRKANFNADPFLQTFGININPMMCDLQGRVLNPPKILYGGRVRF